MIREAYQEKKNTEIDIYGIKNKDLREFTTTEKDLEKGVSRIPLKLARISDVDDTAYA